ncbi:iron hydrogenase small subunit [Campylobacter pinnipediorum]|uniref:Iron hydrogenase n=1 Tax=Campylobacter pinnipediorum subsp. pinnipediorum TaxID=1660067 RepID=A0AAX0L867_9BACT|nr:iron hydrogenase small subunit [Campylobacter pinnipediorum]AQW82452.1 [FeFe] hydrogenase, small subunit [Campylobacter pinnipediorum subsp. pinnipediorum]OPA74832.1 iron hydrogenase [Campylobacter pinnipediorum subsp. pinnipediorum]
MRYQYIEKPVGKIFSRRDFLKVGGVCTAVVAMSGYAITDIIKKRKSYIAMRQNGLYRDDKRCQQMNITSSHQNPSCAKSYADLKTEPMGEIAEKLLHTNAYFDRKNLLLKGASHA